MCAIDKTWQCGEREREYNADGSRRFFRSGYPCSLPKNHAEPHQSCDGQWLHADSRQGSASQLRVIQGGANF